MKRIEKILKFLNKYKFVIALVLIIVLLVLNWFFTSRGSNWDSSTSTNSSSSSSSSAGPNVFTGENKLSLLNALPKLGENFAADYAPFDTDQSVTPTITVHLENTAGRAEFDAWLENYVYPSDTVFVFTEGAINMD